MEFDYSDMMMTEAEAVAVMGRERFERVLARGDISPFRKGYDQPMYRKECVALRLKEDRRLFPDEDDVDSFADPCSGESPHFVAADTEVPASVAKEFTTLVRRFRQVFGGVSTKYK
jgi:hypothetical protein